MSDDTLAPSFHFLDVLITLSDGDKTIQQMIEQCSHLPRSDAERQAKNLASKGYIRPTRDGAFTLAPAGREFLDRWT